MKKLFTCSIFAIAISFAFSVFAEPLQDEMISEISVSVSESSNAIVELSALPIAESEVEISGTKPKPRFAKAELYALPVCYLNGSCFPTEIQKQHQLPILPTGSVWGIGFALPSNTRPTYT